VLVAALASPAVAGLYALCVNIANKTVAAVVALTSFVYPHVAGLQSAGQQAATVGLVHALERAIAAVIVPVLVPGLLLAGPFLRLWLGDFATPELAIAFRILLVAFGVLALAVPVSNVLVACGKSGMSARYSWLTVVVAFGAMYFAVPRFGLVGAAGAMLVGYSTSLLFAASARRVLRIPPAGNRLRFLGGLALGCAAQGLLIAVFGERVANWLDLLALGVAAWASFYAVRAAVSALTPEETQFLRRFAEAAATRAKRWSGRKASR
jgi:O-antigen/teichoic acid export membrane protein